LRGRHDGGVGLHRRYHAGERDDEDLLRSEKLSFGIVDVDQSVESWSIEARDANDAVLATKQLDADPDDYLAGDGEVRFVDFDVSASGGAIREVRVQYIGVEGAGLGFDAFTTTDIPTWVCGDSVVSPGEECDDGNQVSGDGCSDRCAIESMSSGGSGGGGSGGGGSGGGGSGSGSGGGSGGGGSGGDGSGGGGHPQDPGCGCEVAGGSGGERGLAVVALGALALLRRRRSGER
jgi:MYXO-CTERM domain-containing protein